MSVPQLTSSQSLIPSGTTALCEQKPVQSIARNDKQSAKDRSLLLRKGSMAKMPLKEKIVQIYEAFFRGEDPSEGNPNFWDELFLLRVNVPFIDAEFDRLSVEQLVSLQANINHLFYMCCLQLKEDHPIRIVNALSTLSVLIRGVFRKRGADHGFDVINLLIGFDNADSQMQMLIENIHALLVSDQPYHVKTLSLRVMLVLVTATDNVSQNTLLEYVMQHCSLYEALIQILANSSARAVHGHDAGLLLTLLVQYRKYESVNPYVVKLSILDDELALNGFAGVVWNSLSDFNQQYQTKNVEQSTGYFSALTSMVGSLFVGEEKKIEAVKANDSILLALYEAVHLNRNFITTLTNSHTPSQPASPPDSPSTERSLAGAAELGSTGDVANAVMEPSSQPTNLLTTFLEYTSIAMQDIKDEARFNNAKLCMIILMCIAEDQYANSLMHDINMNFRVPLHKTPMRHRKPAQLTKPASRPLACSLIDLMVEFIMSHMMKNFPMELYMKCLSVTHKVLCYQKKCRVRLAYGWKELWTAVINLLKFILSHESYLVKKHDIFLISTKVVNIFNLFITYGDTFLPNPNSYDELYYELIRCHQIFDNLYSMALRYTTSDGQYKDSAIRLTNTLVNVRAIINHFSPKVDSWAAANHLSSLTEEQVLEVVRGNYDTLTLKLQDQLDQHPRYEEKPNETAFFTQLVRSIISDVRKHLAASTVEPMPVLIQDLSPPSPPLPAT